MSGKIKVWVGLGLAAGFAATSAHVGADPVSKPGGIKTIQLAANSGEGGEGGGEGSSTASDENGTDAHYLADLGFVEGHMTVGVELYRLGNDELARTHMKHPADEIYKELEPMMMKRKALRFADELEAVAKAVEAKAPPEEVSVKLEQLLSAIDRAKPAAIEASAAAAAAVILIRTAEEEYTAAFKNGKLTDLHEYQDAWGFTQAAARQLAMLSEAERTEHAKEIAAIENEIDGIKVLWPDLEGKMPVTADIKQLFAAASRIELQAMSIK